MTLRRGEGSRLVRLLTSLFASFLSLLIIRHQNVSFVLSDELFKNVFHASVSTQYRPSPTLRANQTKIVVLTQPALRRLSCSQDGLKLYRETCHQMLFAGFPFKIYSLWTRILLTGSCNRKLLRFLFPFYAFYLLFHWHIVQFQIWRSSYRFHSFHRWILRDTGSDIFCVYIQIGR